MQREGNQKLLAELLAKRAADKAAPAASPPTATIDLTINAAAAQTPFKAAELGADGKPVGTLTSTTSRS